MMRLRSSATIGAMLLSISYALAMFNRNAGTVLAVVLAVSFQLDPAEVSVVATSFFWVYALLQLPAGILADVLGPRRQIALAIACRSPPRPFEVARAVISGLRPV